MRLQLDPLCLEVLDQLLLMNSYLAGAGWGRSSWGEFAWGVHYSVAHTGQSLTSSMADETGFTDVTVSSCRVNP